MPGLSLRVQKKNRSRRFLNVASSTGQQPPERHHLTWRVDLLGKFLLQQIICGVGDLLEKIFVYKKGAVFECMNVWCILYVYAFLGFKKCEHFCCYHFTKSHDFIS